MPEAAQQPLGLLFAPLTAPAIGAQNADASEPLPDPVPGLGATRRQSLPFTRFAAHRQATISRETETGTVSYFDTEPRVVSFPDDDFEKQYPADVYGDEASDHARVWKVYRDQAKEHDDKLLAGWHGSLDILLIFSALFSAILTAFIIESYKDLKQDYAQYTANILFRFASSNSTGLGLPVVNPNFKLSPDDFNPSAPARWVNGLWFTSLIITLSTALLCILAKQWLDEYKATIDDKARTARDWTRHHVQCSNGLSDWHVSLLISVLPALLHVALFLFFIGLGVFLFQLDAGIGYTILGFSVALFGLYTTTIVLAIWIPFCAFRTPLSYQLGRAARPILGQTLRALAVISRTFSLSYSWQSDRVSSTRSRMPSNPAADSVQSKLEAQALQWLIYAAGHNVAAATIQAIGSARRTTDLGLALQRLGVAVLNPLRHYMSYRTPEFTEDALLRFPRLASEYAYCLHAFSVLGANPPAPVILNTFPDPIGHAEPPGSKVEFHHLVNWIVIDASSRRAGPALLKLLSKLLAALTKEHAGPVCSRYTALLLLDVLIGHQDLITGECRTTGVVVSLFLHLIHIAGLTTLEPSHLRIFSDRMHSWFKATDGLRDVFPSRLLSKDPSMIGLEIWSFVALHADKIELDSRTKEMVTRDVVQWAANFVESSRTSLPVARDIWSSIASDVDGLAPAHRASEVLAREALTWATQFVRDTLVGSPSHVVAQPIPYPEFLCDLLASPLLLAYAWSERELETLFRVFEVVRPHDHLWYRAIAHLLRATHRSSIRDGWIPGSSFAIFLRQNEYIAASASGLIPPHPSYAMCFLERDQDYSTPWRALISLLCADGQVGIWVVRIAAALASRLYNQLPPAGSAGADWDTVSELFDDNFLEPCMRSIFKTWRLGVGQLFLNEKTDWKAHAAALQPPLLDVVQFVHNCAFLAPDRVSDVLASLLSQPEEFPRGLVQLIGSLAQQRMVASEQGDSFLRLQRTADDLRRLVHANASRAKYRLLHVPRALAAALTMLHPRPGEDSLAQLLRYVAQATTQDQSVRMPQPLAAYAVDYIDHELEDRTVRALRRADRTDVPGFAEYLGELRERRGYPPLPPTPFSQMWSFGTPGTSLPPTVRLLHGLSSLPSTPPAQTVARAARYSGAAPSPALGVARLNASPESRASALPERSQSRASSRSDAEARTSRDLWPLVGSEGSAHIESPVAQSSAQVF